jgi:hypothetical protein
MPKSTDLPLQCCAYQEIATALGTSDHLVLSPGNTYFLQQDDAHASLDPTGVVDPGVHFGLDSVVGGASESAPTTLS